MSNEQPGQTPYESEQEARADAPEDFEAPSVHASLTDGGIAVMIFIPPAFIEVHEPDEPEPERTWTQPEEVQPEQEGDAPPVA